VLIMHVTTCTTISVTYSSSVALHVAAVAAAAEVVTVVAWIRSIPSAV